MLPIILVVPLVQLLILVNVATMEIKHIKVCIIDNDLSTTSRDLCSKFNNSRFFVVKDMVFEMDKALVMVENNKADMVLQIPSGFERSLMRENTAKVQVLFNAINGTVAGIGSSYVTQIIAGFNRDIITQRVGISPGLGEQGSINIIPAFWYNPDMNYKVFMVPAILVLLVTIIGMALSAVNIIREKEMGNIEQINVTPIRKAHFIIGKLLPFWIIALFMLGFGLTIGKLIFNIPMVGNLALLFVVAALYLLVIQGIGLMISNSSNTFQQAIFSSFFFIIVFIMMSGIFTPTDSMPRWAQIVNYINPIAYFMKLIRMILLKGSGLMDIYKDLLILLFYGLAVLSIAVNRYRKVV